jgi:hypothetical protein
MNPDLIMLLIFAGIDPDGIEWDVSTFKPGVQPDADGTLPDDAVLSSERYDFTTAQQVAQVLTLTGETVGVRPVLNDEQRAQAEQLALLLSV